MHDETARSHLYYVYYADPSLELPPYPDPNTQSLTAARTLNAAIVHADISRSYEEYLEIFDAFYADDIEGSSETLEEPIRGKAGVRSLLFGFLVPLHARKSLVTLPSTIWRNISKPKFVRGNRTDKRSDLCDRVPV